MYSPSEFNEFDNPQALGAFLTQELYQIFLEFQRLNAGELLTFRNAEPSKPRDGLCVLADGTDWNPGSGAGAYCYYNGAWHFLG